MVDDRWYRPAETVLLTGAGFTKSFGGFLASEMSSAILRQGEVQEDQMLYEEIHDAVNYERFYDSVQRSPKFKPEQKNSLSTDIRRVYMQMEKNLV